MYIQNPVNDVRIKNNNGNMKFKNPAYVSIALNKKHTKLVDNMLLSNGYRFKDISTTKKMAIIRNPNHN